MNLFRDLSKGQRWALTVLLRREMNYIDSVLNELVFDCVEGKASWGDHLRISEMWHEDCQLLCDVVDAGITQNDLEMVL